MKVKNLTESTLVIEKFGKVHGVVVNSHSSGTMQLFGSNTDTLAPITGVITFGAAERYVPLFGASLETGLYVAVGGTINYTVVYE